MPIKAWIESRARVLAVLESGQPIKTYEELARQAQVTYGAAYAAVEKLIDKHRLVRDQHGHFIVLAQRPPKPIRKLTAWEIEEARMATPFGYRGPGQYGRKPARQKGWLRSIIINESEAMLKHAPPSDEKLAREIVESKGVAQHERDPVKYQRHARKKKSRGAGRQRTLIEPLQTPEQQRTLQARLREAQLQADRELEHRLDERARAKARDPEKRKRICSMCGNLAHRRPKRGTCSCGERFEPEAYEIELGNASAISLFSEV